jgi:hypothetical protein
VKAPNNKHRPALAAKRSLPLGAGKSQINIKHQKTSSKRLMFEFCNLVLI